MSRLAVLPQRSMRSEILTLLLTLSLSVVVFALLYGSFRDLFSPLKLVSPPETDFYGALIFLDAEQEQAVMQAVRSAWRPNLADVQDHRVDLSALDLPESLPQSVMTLTDCISGGLPAPAVSLDYPAPLSLAAPAPRPLRHQSAAESAPFNPFSRAELLKIED